MSEPDTTPPPVPPVPPALEEGRRAERAAAEKPEDVASGKALAVISYIMNFAAVPFFLIPFFMKSDRFSLYHSKQCMVLWIIYFAAITVSSVLLAVCIGLPLMIATILTGIVFSVLGLLNAINGRAAPLPLIGRWAEDWFRGFQKA